MNGDRHDRDQGASREGRQLAERIDLQARRLHRAEKDRPTLISQTVYLGSVGILFAAPVVAGAYLGRWLDERLQGYSVHWTISLILFGVVIGAVNVYLFIRE